MATKTISYLQEHMYKSSAGDDDDLRPGPSSPGLILPAPIATPLAALTSWGAWGLDDAPLWHSSLASEVATAAVKHGHAHSCLVKELELATE